MGFFDGQARQTAGPQMNRQQMQAIANQQLQAFGQNLDANIQRSGIQFPPEIRGNVPAMCKWMLESGQVPEDRLRIAQPLINRLFPKR